MKVRVQVRLGLGHAPAQQPFRGPHPSSLMAILFILMHQSKKLPANRRLALDNPSYRTRRSVGEVRAILSGFISQIRIGAVTGDPRDCMLCPSSWSLQISTTSGYVPPPRPVDDPHVCQTAATAKACYICNKPTVTVLATINTTDFLYTCPVHLTDRGFATRVSDPDPEPKKPSVSSEEIAKVKQEWEEKQRQKKDMVQRNKDGRDAAEGTKEGEGKDGDVCTKVGGAQDEKPATSTPNVPSEPPRPTHEQYVLHRNIFALRTADHRRRKQVAQTKDLAPRLPGTPSALP